MNPLIKLKTNSKSLIKKDGYISFSLDMIIIDPIIVEKWDIAKCFKLFRKDLFYSWRFLSIILKMIKKMII